MDTDTLVERVIKDGRKLINRLVRQGVDVTAAFWAKTGDDDLWFLYIATESVDEKGPIASYREVNGVLRSIEGVTISTSDVKLIGKKNPATNEVLNLSGRFPFETLGPYRRLLGNLVIDELYIYSPTDRDVEDFSPEFFTVTIPRSSTDLIPFVNTLSPYMGKINECEFEGKAAGTLLFLGPKASATSRWVKLGFAYRPEGWNTMFSGDQNGWEDVANGTTGKPIYQSIDFGPLASSKTAVT